MLDKMLSAIAEKFPVTEIDAGDMSKAKASGMTFNIKAYYAKGLGHVSLMSAKGFFGLMKMDTLIINPTEKDLPLYSYDRIHAMGNDTLIVELYDTLLGQCHMDDVKSVKNKYAGLPAHPLGEHWYDSIKLPESISVKGKGKISEEFDKYAMEHMMAYLKATSDAENIDADAKREKASVYVEGLLKNGGPSTDVFKKAIGDDKTAYLFRKILFGTENIL